MAVHVTFNADFNEGLSLTSMDHKGETLYTGRFHRLTPEQFDALVEAFDIVSTFGERTMTTDGRYGPPRTFRTATINLGGLKTELYADVPALEVDANQLSLLDN
jgi:hypothetical protein